MEPTILELIPDGVSSGFDNLMLSMLKQELSVYAYKHSGLRMDIWNEDDFNSVQQALTGQYKSRILGC